MKLVSRQTWEFLHARFGGGPELSFESACQVTWARKQRQTCSALATGASGLSWSTLALRDAFDLHAIVPDLRMLMRCVLAQECCRELLEAERLEKVKGDDIALALTLLNDVRFERWPNLEFWGRLLALPHDGVLMGQQSSLYISKFQAVWRLN
eukprot:2898581-Pleurochrysis_carterae.AAC.1